MARPRLARPRVERDPDQEGDHHCGDWYEAAYEGRGRNGDARDQRGKCDARQHGAGARQGRREGGLFGAHAKVPIRVGICGHDGVDGKNNLPCRDPRRMKLVTNWAAAGGGCSPRMARTRKVPTSAPFPKFGNRCVTL